MSLDKAIASGKEHRKPYTGSKAFDLHCRDARCPYCHENKFFANKKRKQSVADQIKQYGDLGQ